MCCWRASSEALFHGRAAAGRRRTFVPAQQSLQVVGDVEAARTLCLDPPVQEGFGVVLALSIGREQPALADEGQAGAGGRGEAAEWR